MYDLFCSKNLGQYFKALYLHTMKIKVLFLSFGQHSIIGSIQDLKLLNN